MLRKRSGSPPATCAAVLRATVADPDRATLMEAMAGVICKRLGFDGPPVALDKIPTELGAARNACGRSSSTPLTALRPLSKRPAWASPELRPPCGGRNRR